MGAWLLLQLAKPKVLLTIAVIAVLLGAFAWYGAKRESAGYANGTRSQLEVDKTQFEQVQKQFTATLATEQAKIVADDAKIQSLSIQLNTVSSQLIALASQRTQAQQQVNKLPDSALQADLETKLGGSLTDPTTLRKTDDIVTDYPLVLKAVDGLNAKVDLLTQSVSVVAAKADAIAVQRDAAIQFGNTVVGYYAKAYNAAQIHHSKFIKVITFGLVHDKHLDLPNPTNLNVPKTL